MKCVILAAGISSRMRSLTGEVPKCLLSVGGRPILQRIIENVLLAGVDRIGIVLGYKADLVREKFPNTQVQFIDNPEFASTNNACSLLASRDFCLTEAGGNVPPERLLLLDSDIVFSPDLLPFLVHQPHPDVVAVRVEGDHNDEEIRVMVDEEKRIVLIGKETPLAATYGESIGIEIFSYGTAERLFRVLERRVRAGAGRSEFYEASFQAMIDEGAELRAVDVTRFPATEIDTPEDLAYAEQVILPKLLSL